MTSPLQGLPPTPRWVAFGLLLVAVVVVGQLMASSQQTMRAQQGEGDVSYGIVDLELAGPDKAATILDAWGPVGSSAAREQIRIDYLWLVLYAGAFAVGCVAVGQQVGGRWEAVGVLLSWAAVTAGVLDAVENTAMLAVLDGNLGAARLAQLAAWPKFVLAVPAGAFAVVPAVFLAVLAGWHLVRRRLQGAPA